jgi:hypothetical protein
LLQVTGAVFKAEQAHATLSSLQQINIHVLALVLLGTDASAFLRTAMELGMTGRGYVYITTDFGNSHSHLMSPPLSLQASLHAARAMLHTEAADYWVISTSP